MDFYAEICAILSDLDDLKYKAWNLQSHPELPCNCDERLEHAFECLEDAELAFLDASLAASKSNWT